MGKKKDKKRKAIKANATNHTDYGAKFSKVGMLVMINRKPPKSKKLGFKLKQELEIQEPPKGYLNTLMGVFVKAPKTGKLIYLQFQYIQYKVKNKKDESKSRK